MWVVKNRNWIVGIIGALMLVTLVLTFSWKPNLSIEFTGGTVITGEYASSSPSVTAIQESLESLELGTVRLQPLGEKGLVMRSRDLSQDEHAKVVALLSDGTNEFKETSLSTVGPSVGKELRQKAVLSVLLVLILIILFVAYAFRSVSNVVSSWKYGIVVVITLVHDIFVPTGVFVILSHYLIGYEIDTLFVTALLAILGYSVADTIVVFDRIRENLKNSPEIKPPGTEGLISESFADLVGRSLRETYVRSTNTSLTTVLASLAIFFFGGEATKHFALMLAVGITAGTYSSILLASPLLVLISGKSPKLKFEAQNKP
ncbi:MAG: protein-export membrane protein SecF [Candidatus Wildermuthbacteria bacterium RIFCSPLOWO2_01_FULL_47_18]|uniref:Protein-export membrane protein SecF n=1 Tax=Candidatus Wildermuthbacteria bacterium RIFCSPLOWO2_01_FULL_47_18 TaxID=1802460 RepID=A0A1G2RKA5_9BACT|nr:MAG: protein-export membrane protein SecF [Candidatus Wildermuthbacteria bacterium RIFCSPLOWO2_01_FULL_47_18]OHB18307.1 MAG: protein-export membrane protein SecF [Parcubacteria group bacterium RIFCSPHIGHO2_01_FULL_45_26]